jgi:hydroxymethylpyrimidine pyrophosphatase-like HAD family hydrolase
VAKHTALDFLRQHYSVALGSLLFAGDSGNDLAALVSGCAAILVANAPERVRRQVVEQSGGHPESQRIYLAEAPDILGVVEGCRHFGLL